MADSGNLFCGSLCQLFGSARLWCRATADDPHSFLATIHGIGQIIGVLTVLPLSGYLGCKRTVIISNAIIGACLAAILLIAES